MAKQQNEIRVRLIVDGKEVTATLISNNREVERLVQNFNKANYSGTAASQNVAAGFNNARMVLQGLRETYNMFQTAFGKPLELHLDAQQASAAFEVLTGNVENANKLLNELKELSTKYSMDYSGLREQAKLLLNFNIELNEVIPIMKTLGDITGGNKQRMDSLALAFAQSSSAGRLMGQDLMQMVNAGFNPLQVIAEKTGKSIDELKKEMEKGKIPFEQVKQAFLDAASEGGKFHGMLEKMSSGDAASLNRFNSLVKVSQEESGKLVAKALTPLLDSVSSLMKYLNEANPTILGVASAGATLTGVLITLRVSGIMPSITKYNVMEAAIVRTNYQMKLAAMQGIAVNRSLIMMNQSIRALLLSIGPGGWLLLGLSAYVGLTAAFSNNTKEVTTELSEEEKQLKKNQTELNTLFSILKDNNIEQNKRADAFKKLKQHYPEYLKNLISEKDNIKKIEEAQRLANKEFEKKIKLAAQEKVLSEYYNKIVDLEYQKVKKQQEIEKRLFEEKDNDTYEKMMRDAHGLNSELTEIEKQIQNTTEEMNKFQKSMDKTVVTGGGGGGDKEKHSELEMMKLKRELNEISLEDYRNFLFNKIKSLKTGTYEEKKIMLQHLQELRNSQKLLSDLSGTTFPNTPEEAEKYFRSQFKGTREDRRKIQEMRIRNEKETLDVIEQLKLDAMQNGTEKEMMRLEIWYSKQQEIYRDNEEVLTQLKATYEAKRQELNIKSNAIAEIGADAISSGFNQMWNELIIGGREAKDEWDAIWLAMRNTALKRISEVVMDEITNLLINLLAMAFGGDAGFLKMVTKVIEPASGAVDIPDSRSISVNPNLIMNDSGAIGILDKRMGQMVATLQGMEYKLRGEDIYLSGSRAEQRIKATEL